MSQPGDDIAQPVAPEPKPSARRAPWNLWLDAGVALIVIVGGIGISLALASVTTNCVSEPNSPALFSAPSCNNLLASGVAAAVVAGIAVGIGGLLLRQAHVRRSRQIPLVAGIFVGLVIVIAVVPLAYVPPPANPGIPPGLPFPIPAGTTFTATTSELGAYAQAQVPQDPYVPYAPIYIEGAFNATATVCVYIGRAAGPDLGPGAHGVCGQAVSFAFGLTPSTWAIAFYVPQANPQIVDRATVVITQAVQIVY